MPSDPTAPKPAVKPTPDTLSELPAAEGPADAKKVPDDGRERGVENIEGDAAVATPDADPDTAEDVSPLDDTDALADEEQAIDDANEPDREDPVTTEFYNGPGSESRRLSADPPQAYTGAG